MSISIHTIFCDDIRQENSGKLLLIGVYAEDLVPSQIPIQFPMSIFIKVEGLAPGHHSYSMSISFPEGNKIEPAGEIMVGDKMKPVNFILGALPAQVGAPGEIEVRIALDGKRTRLAGKLVVQSPRTTETKEPTAPKS